LIATVNARKSTDQPDLELLLDERPQGPPRACGGVELD
jgi:hypothetical protein